jgi:hypothetical protein
MESIASQTSLGSKLRTAMMVATTIVAKAMAPGLGTTEDMLPICSMATMMEMA